VGARPRLDVELVRRGMTSSREQAQELINQGRVQVNGVIATKAASQVDASTSIVISEIENGIQYASRGGHKLAGALEAFEVQVQAKRCLDAGASTGGFTDVLLRAGAAEVVAVDVGYGQLVWTLQQDPRVRILDRTNVRHLTPEMIEGFVDLVVADLSFISLTVVLPALTSLAPSGELLLMVKPQFEVGKERLGSGGVVREPQLRQSAIEAVATNAMGLGWAMKGVVASPLPGPAGNVEYFLWLIRGDWALDRDAIAAAVADGPQ
jgi:23S rRNA (cytidine1920-2'-O)/16S rRNA (cytidine1409-2'-O)-methyltransferase